MNPTEDFDKLIFEFAVADPSEINIKVTNEAFMVTLTLIRQC